MSIVKVDLTYGNLIDEAGCTYRVGDFIEVSKQSVNRDDGTEINLVKVTGYLESIWVGVLEIWVTRIGGSGINFDESVHINIPLESIKAVSWGNTEKHVMTESEAQLHKSGELRYSYE